MRRKAAPVLIVLALMLGSLYLPMLMVVPASAGSSSDPGWLAGWRYRMPITIDYPSAIDYAVQVEIVLSSSNFTGWADMRSDGGDIRFTLSDGVTEIPYAIEEFNYTAKYAKIVVKVPQLPTTIYMYWGNPTATSKSNPDEVYIFYDDFSRYQAPQAGPSLPEGRGDCDAVVLPNGTILVFGGYYPDGSSPKDTVYKFNGTGWELVSTMPVALWGMDAVALPNGTVLLFGGRDSAGNERYEYYKYDPDTNTWVQLGTVPLTASIMQGIMAIYNPDKDWVHVICQSDHYVYIPSNDTWVQKASPPAPRRWGTLAYYNGKLYLLGGRDDSASAITSTVYIYDVNTDTWSTGSSAPIAFMGAGRDYALYEDVVVIPGFLTSGSAFDSRIMVYNITEDKWYWTLFSNLHARDGFSTAMINGTLYVIGGRDSSGGLPNVDVIDVETLIRSYHKWIPNYIGKIYGNVENGWYIVNDAYRSDTAYWIYDPTDTGNQHKAINTTALPPQFAIEFKLRIIDDEVSDTGEVGIALTAEDDTVITYVHVGDNQASELVPYVAVIGESLPANYPSDWGRYDSGSPSYNYGIRKIVPSGTEYFVKMVYKGSVVEVYNETMKICDVSITSTPAGIALAVGHYTSSAGNQFFDGSGIQFVKVSVFLDPPPSVALGAVESAGEKTLPSDSMFLIHEIGYSPNSTQFTHSFMATNTTTADYETNYTSPYGWRVYANPYQSGGTGYENTATLISEVNITLPYSEVLVENVTLLARTNGTGSFRQLWVRVLNSTGDVVAELTNATIGTSWAKVTLTVNASLSNQVTVWINATVKSTATAGEEIGIKDVVLHVRYEESPVVRASWVPNRDFNCSASFFVELGDTSLLNTSVIHLKLIEYLVYNATDYPVKPVYEGNETIGAHLYNVYRVEPANYSQAMNVYAILENKFKTFTTRVKSYITDTALVGEPITIELPVVGNVTIPSLNMSFINVTSVTVRFNATGTYIIEVNRTRADIWSLGYGSKAVIVKYGSFIVNMLDVDSKVVDYEDLTLQLVDKANDSTIREVSGNAQFALSNLWAGNYTVLVRFKDITVGARDFELNITTDASTINMYLAMRSLAKDYRGLNRTVAYDYTKKLLGVENLSSKFPYSRMRILLNGTGSFKLYINYRGDLPTKVDVVGNVSNLEYYWNGTYLVIEGTLGSVGELKITDLYRLRVEIYDRLGNLMPSWIYAYVNETKYSGAVVEDYYYPEDYVVKLPPSINGFEFFGFWDGFNESTRTVSINNSDVTLKVWYRVPTRVEGVRSYQVAGTALLPFLREEGETVRVYIEGYLKDYYGAGVPNRPLTINITNVETGYTRSYNVTTDIAGYFRSPVIELPRGKTYRVEVIYGGDDIYVGTVGTSEIKPEELPTAPLLPSIPTEYLLGIAGLVIVGVSVFAIVRAVGHIVTGITERKFVRRRRNAKDKES